jgi:hypothetical protein
MKIFARWGWLGLAVWICCGCSHSHSNARALHAVITAHQGDTNASGEWEWKDYSANMSRPARPDYFQIEIRDEKGSSRFSSGFPSQDLAWITTGANQVEKAEYAIRFSLIRPSGEWNFYGNAASTGAAGKFDFTPNAAFVDEAAKLCGGRPTLDEAIHLSFLNATLDSLRQFQSAGLSLQVKDWIRLLSYGVSADYASAMRAALGKLTVDALVECGNYGMTADFAAGYTKAGYEFDYKELIRLRNYGVQPNYAAEFKKGGMALSGDQLVRLRNYGVQPSYALRIKELGYGENLDDIVKMRNYGVQEEFIAGIKQAGYTLSMDEIIKLRNYGVPVSYLGAVKKAGYSFTLDEIVKLRNYGVSESFLAEIIVPGRKPLSADTIVNLRSRGVSAETIKALRAE